ncbi:unnamed protein product, partial [Owenia fusiformis]
INKQWNCKMSSSPKAMGGTGSGGEVQMKKLQGEVKEVTHLLKDNMNKVMERGDKLDDLQDRSEGLQAESKAFKRTANRAKWKFCRQNAKMTACLIGIVILVIIVIVVVVVVTVKPWEKGTNPPPQTTNATILN